MFDIGFTELLVVGVVALIVIGPKDLPTMFRTLGRMTARARALGREFTSAMNAAADQSGMKDVAKDLKGMTNPSSYGMNKLKEAADSFDKWTPAQPRAKAEAEAADDAGEAPAKTPEIDPKRAEDIAKIRETTEKMGRARMERDAAAKAEAAAQKAETAAGALKPDAPAKADDA